MRRTSTDGQREVGVGWTEEVQRKVGMDGDQSKHYVLLIYPQFPPLFLPLLLNTLSHSSSSGSAHSSTSCFCSPSPISLACSRSSSPVLYLTLWFFSSSSSAFSWFLLVSFLFTPSQFFTMLHVLSAFFDLFFFLMLTFFLELLL